MKCRPKPKKRLSDGIFACNSNAAGQNQGASDTVIGHPNRVNLGLT
ncbi:TPA: peptide chain release factor domain protein [Neisseria gonorrhoeae]|nr:peptide chain release factor domain protein [Neisseria gonorrhoeae]OZV75514.1 peptide chain release factor domain protein [Neisseria gonorrhoeae]TJX08506.1 peptide chain release factor domain protein [Neisseria gonorrhoeae]TJX17759.1 peptide chain release factor domain protein [Neisseria gonorrhoeae]TLL59773.1 peptide chain release factor domain protein [Neisseria gonorrhoeae]